jgi:alpha-D-ribose 1-methylphosphonate 5-triphosphate synthase subunit PhnH
MKRKPLTQEQRHALRAAFDRALDQFVQCQEGDAVDPGDILTFKIEVDVSFQKGRGVYIRYPGFFNPDLSKVQDICERLEQGDTQEDHERGAALRQLLNDVEYR